MKDAAVTPHAVRHVEVIHGELFVLSLERNGLEFAPGDCVALRTDGEESRPYSIASGNREDTLRFLIRKMEGGEVSPWLMSRRPGDIVQVSPPFGWFRPAQDIGDAPFVFIATGTGVAPFLSFRGSFGHKAPTLFLYGLRRKADAVGVEQLVGWCKLKLAISREKTEDHYHGRVTALLEEMPLRPDTHYYLCGLESMISETTRWLEEQGVDLFHIHREVFFHG